MNDNYNNEKVKKIMESEKIPERLEPDNIKELLDNSSANSKRKQIRHNKILKIVSAAAALAIVFGTSVYFIKPNFSNIEIFSDKDIKNKVSIESMKSATAYGDVLSYFSSTSKSNQFRDFLANGFGGNKFLDENYDLAIADAYTGEMELAEDSVNSSASEDGYVAGEANNIDADVSEEKDYSDTYSQEAGVLEADIVKTNGNKIFYSNGDTIYISDTQDGKFVSPYKTDISDKLGLNVDGTISDMYIYNNQLIVICDYYEVNNDYKNDYDTNYDIYIDDCYYYGGNSNTYVAIFDIEDVLKVVGYYVQEGYYNDVRLMSDGYLYVISNSDKYLDYNEVTDDDIDEYIPFYYVGDEKCYVEPEDIMIPTCAIRDVYNYVSYTNISGLDLNSETPNQPVDSKSIAGYSNTIYCSQENLYVTSGYEQTEITRFSVENGNITPQASGKIKGYINDQFSMSEYNGYFRVAVTEDGYTEIVEDVGNDSTVVSRQWASQKNSIYVLDMSMNVVGSISDFGLDENIRSVNFNGDMAYVVTFRQTDPLYAIDLSNPLEPTILDELKISGYSSYMQKWTDGLLLGFGASADEQTGWQTGVKMTMFDNSDPNNLQEISTVSFERQSDYESISSEGIYERKALFIDYEKNIIGFPINEYNYEYDENYQNKSSYKFYSFQDNTFVYKGEIVKDSSTDAYVWEAESFRRVVYIDGYFYAVSCEEFKAADAVNFVETDVTMF